MRTPSRALSALLAFSLLLPTTAAFAGGKSPPPDSAKAADAGKEREAQELKRQGDTHLSEKRFVEALEAYDRSYALVANPALHYNRGRALQFLARYPEALESVERFEKEAPEDLKAKVPGLAELDKELRAKVATVVIETNAKGGRVLVGGKDVGQAPLDKPLRVNAGKATVEVIAEGFFPFRREVELPGDATTKVDARVASRDTFGYLIVKSQVAAARVFVDDKVVGVVPAEAALTPGAHPVRVTAEGFGDAETQVVLAAGERKELSLDPQKSPSIFSRWWFWTGVGVLVVGAAVTTTAIAVTTEGSPPTGDFSPGQVRF
jgi:hypothetical protein